MRITGGEFSGRHLHTPKTSQIRPMRDQVRSALFNMLSGVVPGARFLDLFAGTGSVAIEALSRGAAEAVFVDKSREAIGILNENIVQLKISDRARVIQDDVFSWINSNSESPFDLIFIGPPYYNDLANRAMNEISGSQLFHEESILFAEVFKKEGMQEQYGALVQIEERTYGDNKIHFYRAGE